MAVLKKLSIDRFTYDPVIPLKGMYAKELENKDSNQKSAIIP